MMTVKVGEVIVEVLKNEQGPTEDPRRDHIQDYSLYPFF